VGVEVSHLVGIVWFEGLILNIKKIALVCQDI